MFMKYRLSTSHDQFCLEPPQQPTETSILSSDCQIVLEGLPKLLLYLKGMAYLSFFSNKGHCFAHYLTGRIRWSLIGWICRVVIG